MAEKTYKFPKKLGTCADKFYALRKARQAAQKKVDEMHTEEKALKEHIINTLPKSASTGVAGKVARVTVVRKVIPQAKDWSKIQKYIKRTGAFDLLQRRINTKAVQERWADGKKVAGVEPFTLIDVSLNKL